MGRVSYNAKFFLSKVSGISKNKPPTWAGISKNGTPTQAHIFLFETPNLGCFFQVGIMGKKKKWFPK
jgi:hypothetical protein